MAITRYFNGIAFRRYPDAEQWSHRVYYSPGMRQRKLGIGYLHQEVWKAVNGPIPEGHEIHHLDFDPDNNEIVNLACLTEAEHNEAHAQRRSERRRTPKAEAELERMRVEAAKWHGSEAGRQWHSEHAIAQGFGRGPERSGVCEQCGGEYTTVQHAKKDRFCSNKCKSAWRRASGVDDVQRPCARCSELFTVNRYVKKQYCGPACGQRARVERA